MARVAVVTGGTRGIGAAVSEALRKAGYKVAATYHSNDRAADEFTGKTGVPHFKFDVGDFEACKQGIAKIQRALGPIDVLVNNAGITHDEFLPKIKQDKWNNVIHAKLTSVIIL